MTRLRATSLSRLHHHFGEATLEWTAEPPQSTLDPYVVPNGIYHLLCLDRRHDAEQRLLDLVFMEAFTAAWPDVSEPIRTWRVLGIERGKQGFTQLDRDLLASDSKEISLCRTAQVVARSLEEFGWYEPAMLLATCSA